MKIQQSLSKSNAWETLKQTEGFVNEKANLVLVFGGKEKFTPDTIKEIGKQYPSALVVSTSTAGEILDKHIYDEELSMTAIEFEKTALKNVQLNIKDCSDSFDIGSKLMKELPKEDLSYAMVLSDGALINGTELVEGLLSENAANVLITGGLAGDGARFTSTIVGINDNLEHGNVILIGFYGKNIKVGNGSLGGWSEFGPERTITKAEKNVLFEIENKSALALYKEYLGEYAKELPGSALLFPLSLSINNGEDKIVRTILSIDEKTDAMTFAGNMPVGSKVRLMKANFDKIINASETAAESANDAFKNPDLALLISCVGRKLILNERVVEEVENAKAVFGPKTFITGFYSYGEISPLISEVKCELQNQTMTITTISEI